MSSEAKLLRLRRDDRCASCGIALPAGSTSYWSPDRRCTECTACRESDPIDERYAQPVPREHHRGDTAGASARAEYEKRAGRERCRQEKAVAEDAAWRANVISRHRLLGPLITALAPKPVIVESASTTAWRIGAEGEERVAAVLSTVTGIEVLHDRKWPGTRRANIDHIVVGASAVFVIDTKNYQGRIQVVDKGSWFRPDWRLYVDGRNQTRRVDSVLDQVDAVSHVLGGDSDVPVRGVLCFVGAEWGLLGRRKSTTLNGVKILSPAKLARLVGRPGSVDVRETAARLRRALRPAS